MGSEVFSAFQENESIIRRFLRRFTSQQHDVDDICQETIMRALEAERSKSIHDPRAFLFGVARNVVRKDLDRKSRQLVDFINDFTPDQYLADQPTVEEELDSDKRLEKFALAVASLPSQCQKVFVLKKMHGYSHKEIARKLGISISTVEKHAAAGLKRCSEQMNCHDIGSEGNLSNIRAQSVSSIPAQRHPSNEESNLRKEEVL